MIVFKNHIKYKDVWVAPGSKTHDALTSNDKDAPALALSLYKAAIEMEKRLLEKK
jgi:hypothetical protein